MFKHFKWWLLLGLTSVTILVWLVVVNESRLGILTVYFLDVGQGDAILIEAPNGNQMLIDGGRNQQVIKELSQVMPFYDRSIDLILATHPDADHIGGLSFVADRYQVSAFLSSGYLSSSTPVVVLNQVLNDRNIKMIEVSRGMRIILDDDVYFDILFPDRKLVDVDSNEASVIGELVYGQTEFIFTGDAPQKIETYLVRLDGTRLQAEVLKIGHHGSRTSTAGEFLSLVKPEIAIISAGGDNQYGHPHLEVLDLLKQAEVEVLTTYEQGTIKITSDGRTISVEP